MRSPLTFEHKSTLLQTFDAQQLRASWQGAFKIDIQPYLSDIKSISRWVCDESGLLFFTPLECAGPADLYRQLREFEWYYMPDKWEYDEALKLLPRQGRLLEIGCGDGHFLKKAARKGLCVEGLEMTAPDQTNKSQQVCSIREGSAQDHAASYRGCYDVVCSFQVLEHIVEPRAFLQASLELLAPGGIMLISTPNAHSFLRHAFNVLDMPPHHMTGWSEQSYRFLETMLPLKLENLLFEPLAEYHIDYFAHTYNSRFNGRFDFRGAWARGTLGSVSKRLLRMGGRYLVRGQSMLAVFRKIGSLTPEAPTSLRLLATDINEKL